MGGHRPLPAATAARPLANRRTTLTPSRSAHALRIRKELRNLTPREYRLFLQGMSTLLSVPTSAGQKVRPAGAGAGAAAAAAFDGPVRCAVLSSRAPLRLPKLQPVTF